MGFLFEDSVALDEAIREFFHKRFDPAFPLEITAYADSAPCALLYGIGFSEIWYKSYYLAWGQETLLIGEVSGFTNRPRRDSAVEAIPGADIEVLRWKERSFGGFGIWLQFPDRRLRLNFARQSADDGRRLLAALTRPPAA